MNRYAINDLITWKKSSRRKPLIVEGARQVGKTWLVTEFASRFYKNIAYVNFEDQKNMRELFAENYDINRILQTISLATETPIYPGETLIFLMKFRKQKTGLRH